MTLEKWSVFFPIEMKVSRYPSSFRFCVWQWPQLLQALPVVREPRIPCWRTWESWWRRHNWIRCHQKRSNNWRRSLEVGRNCLSWCFLKGILEKNSFKLVDSWGMIARQIFISQQFDQEIKQDAVELVQPQQILEAERKSKDVPSNLVEQWRSIGIRYLNDDLPWVYGRAPQNSSCLLRYYALGWFLGYDIPPFVDRDL